MTEENKKEQEFEQDYSQKDEEKINLLPFLTVILILVVIFQFWQILNLQNRLKAVTGGGLVPELAQTRDYLKRLYEYYGCNNYYNSATSTNYQIYNLLLCLNEKSKTKK